MRSHILIRARQGSVIATAYVDAELNWIPLAMRDSEKIGDFTPEDLCDLTIANERGSWRYVPVEWNRWPIWSRLKWAFGGQRL